MATKLIVYMVFLMELLIMFYHLWKKIIFPLMKQ